MENNKQTALQFFLTGLIDLEIAKDLSNDDVRQMHDLFNIAKEMEKQQIIKAHMNVNDDRDYRMQDVIIKEFAEQYYREQYGK